MALEFDGVDQGITIPTFGIFDGSQSFSIMAWVTVDALTGNSNTIFYFGGERIIYLRTTQTWRANLSEVTCTKAAGGDIILNGTNLIGDGLVLLTAIYDSTNGWELWENITQRDTDAWTGIIQAIAQSNTMGFLPGDLGCHDGKIFDARIYNRALSAEEIMIIYYSKGNDNIVSNLDARWLMNEKPDGGTATVASSVIDVSGNGNHGTPANSPVYRAASVRLVRSVLLTPISGHFKRTFTETLTLTDTVSKKVAKTFTEILHLTDTFSKAIKYYRTFTEKITLTDKVKVAKINLVNLIKKLIQLMDIRRW